MMHEVRGYSFFGALNTARPSIVMRSTTGKVMLEREPELQRP